MVELGEHELVARVRKVVDDSLHLVADTLYLVVGLVAEKHLHGVGHAQEAVVAGIGGHLLTDAVESRGVGLVVGVADDDLLAEDVALLA